MNLHTVPFLPIDTYGFFPKLKDFEESLFILPDHPTDKPSRRFLQWQTKMYYRLV